MSDVYTLQWKILYFFEWSLSQLDTAPPFMHTCLGDWESEQWSIPCASIAEWHFQRISGNLWYQMGVSQTFYFCYTDLREQLIRWEDLFWLLALIHCTLAPSLCSCDEEEHHGSWITLGNKVVHLTSAEKWREKDRKVVGTQHSLKTHLPSRRLRVQGQ